MFKNIRTLIRIFVLALITVVVGGLFIILKYNNVIETPNSQSSDKVVITIDQGEALDSVINELVKKGVLKENWKKYLKAYLRLNDLSAKIQAGTFSIPKDLNITELVETLQNAEGQDVWVTIPEGLRKDEIADILDTEFSDQSTIDFSKTEFLELTVNQEYIQKFSLPAEVVDLEGYIFPDKYAFSIESTTESVLDKMVKTFVDKVGTDDLYEDIILASIVEREGYNSNDRAIIADILQRRLKEGWLLQVDASLLYPVKDWNHKITQVDKDNDNLYNTYKYIGLPPTPICNPGLESINAVRNPEPNNYYYYMHDNDGNAHYSTTLSEHIENVDNYLR